MAKGKRGQGRVDGWLAWGQKGGYEGRESGLNTGLCRPLVWGGKGRRVDMGW